MILVWDVMNLGGSRPSKSRYSVSNWFCGELSGLLAWKVRLEAVGTEEIDQQGEEWPERRRQSRIACCLAPSEYPINVYKPIYLINSCIPFQVIM